MVRWVGGRKEDRREERVIPKLPEQFVTLEWLLGYPGGPLSRKVFRSSSGEKGGARSSREWSEVMACSRISGVSIGAGGWRGRKEAKKGGVVRELLLARAPFSLACL